ncbi:MAG: DUF1801 domain-containing protein [Gemmatimonadota bacterium]
MTGTHEVDAWMAEYDNPMKPVVQRVREIILGADPRMAECVKWKSPTFVFEGNLASFNPRSKKHASLMFHTGAQIPGTHPALEGGGDVARYIKFESVEDAERLQPDLERLVRAWIELKTG